MNYLTYKYYIKPQIDAVISALPPILMILAYILYFLVFEISPDTLEPVVDILHLSWLFPDYLFVPLVIALYPFLYSVTLVINVLVNKYIYHSPHPATGLLLPKKLNSAMIICLNL